MRKSRFTESQIFAVLKQGEAGVPVAEICREHGISNATYYQWKTKYAGVEPSELRRLRELEAENARLGLGLNGVQHLRHPVGAVRAIFREIVAHDHLFARLHHHGLAEDLAARSRQYDVPGLRGIAHTAGFHIENHGLPIDVGGIKACASSRATHPESAKEVNRATAVIRVAKRILVPK